VAATPEMRIDAGLMALLASNPNMSEIAFGLLLEALSDDRVRAKASSLRSRAVTGDVIATMLGDPFASVRSREILLN
jgi:hypothetical protein